MKTSSKRLKKTEGTQHDSNSVPISVIQPTTGWRFLDLGELWAYRELIYFLTWRDVKIRYKQTALGFLWVLIQPLAMMVVFTLFFGKLAKIPSEGVPYPIFAFAALLPWQLFSRSLSDSSNSLVADQRLITRVYFPRIIVPTASTFAAMADFAVASALLVGLMAWYGIVPSINVLFLPAFLLLMLVTSLGIGLWLAALNLEFRDVRYMLPFLSQILLFLTPVVYPSSLVPDRWRLVYGLNPMAGVVEGFRWALLGVGPGPSPLLMASATMATALFLGGIVFFRWRERTFVDVVGSGGR